MSRQVLDELKQQIPLLDYLQAHDWQPARQLSRGRWMGLCPLHPDHKPSFLVDPGKSLFYCYGCGRGGDVIRFAELYHQVKFPQALTLLHQWRGLAPLLHQVTGFYRMQLHRHGEAVAYLHQRGVRSPEVIEHMRIGYAPGGCLRGWLTQLGYPLPTLRQAGLVTGVGYDAYVRRIVFPLEGNLYGRSLSDSAPPHRFLPGTKGGLYSWEQVRRPSRRFIRPDRLFDDGSARVRDLSSQRYRSFRTPSSRSPCQSHRQNPHSNQKTRTLLKMGRVWPVKSGCGTSTHEAGR